MKEHSRASLAMAYPFAEEGQAVNREGGFVQRSRKSESPRPPAFGSAMHAQRFVFFDRRTGTKRFEVKALEDGSFPVDQAASLLAIQCVARQRDPRDFSVMVALTEDLVDGLVGRATQLIRSCSEAKLPVALSRRQHQVLGAVAQNLSNKEIADRLNVSVRTVKFHVSALLEKFEVVGRVDLMLEATDLMSRDAVHRRKTDRDSVSVYPSGFKTTLIEPGAALGGPMPLDRRAEGQALGSDPGQNGRNHNQPRTASTCKHALSSSMTKRQLAS
jgi:DNA-binding CsgD family transcriptional regulator